MRKLLCALGTLWALPGSALGLLLGLVFLPRGVRLRGWCLQVTVRYLVPTRAAAMTWGNVVLVDDWYAGREGIWQHELVHVRQWWALGPLFPLAYLLCSLWAWLRGQDPYYGNRLEVQAYEEGSDG